MAKFCLILLLLCFSHFNLNSAHETLAGSCDNDSWYLFKDEKCIKIIDQLVTRESAQQICDEFGGAGLLKISSLEEQEFLTQLIFDTYQVVDNVWLGAIRKTDSPTDFWWEDQTEFRFTNWAEESPSGDFEKNCTQLSSHLGRRQFDGRSEVAAEGDGFWTDVVCSRRNVVVCQKFQNWSIVEIENAFFDQRYELAEVEAKVEKLIEANEAMNFEPAQDPLTIKSCTEIQRPKDHPKALTSQFINRNENEVIYPLGPGEPKNVRCDFETDGGGWTVIQHRSSGPKEQFYLDWHNYEEGFGDVDGNYWIGLKAIHTLTSSPQELRIDMEDWEGNKLYAQYSQFAVGNSSEFYRLTADGYSGNANDSLAYHNGAYFSTFDVDNDSNSGSCAQQFHGAWWYTSCLSSNLNGYYYEGGYSYPSNDGLLWVYWKNGYYSLKFVEMKIRDVRS